MSLSERSDVDVGSAEIADNLPAICLLLGRRPGANIDDVNADVTQAIPGLFCARRSGVVVGALWARQAMPGVISIWQPMLKSRESPVTETLLYDSLREYMDHVEFRVARALADRDSGFARRLVSAGFHIATEIVSMVWLPEADSAIDAKLVLKVNQQERDAEFAELLQATYVDTLDCPQLVNLLSAADMLNYYRKSAPAPLAEAICYRAEYGGETVGAAVLTFDEAAESVELTYVGVLPEHRGKGFGIKTVKATQRLAQAFGARRMSVAVDEANSPADRIYRNAGFISYASQSLLVRV